MYGKNQEYNADNSRKWVEIDMDVLIYIMIIV